MEAITIPHIHIPSIDIGGICLPGIGVPDGGKKGLIWPKGLKESIKAIYDPAKQGMTNYDVIEAYAEDFTYWTINNTSITSTQKKIVIPAGTELEYVIAYRGFNGFTDGFDIKYTGNAVITYRYNKEDGTVGTIAIDKSGIYHLPASVRAQKNFGFYCNPQTVTEEATIEQLPTSILKDLSGNGNHAYLYGGKGKLNSGMGVYQEDFTTFNKNDNVATYENVSSNICHIIEFKSTIAFLYKSTGTKINSITVKISGNFNGTTIVWQYYLNDKLNSIDISEPGIYTLPGSDGTGRTSGFYNRVAVGKVDITITQIPDYPNQLCYDGKMYAVCYGFPILTDYTVIADRTWFDKTGVRCFCSKYKDNTAAALFKFEWVAGNKEYTSSFGKDTNVVFVDSNITWQTKTSYNGKALTNLQYEDGEHLIIGNRYEGDYSTYVGCHGKIIIADRSFTEDEITWLKDNFFSIDIPIPAYDFDFSKLKSGENIFPDKYGNELSLYNFAWSGMSGKDGYTEDFTKWGKYANGVSVANNTITISANINIVGNWIAWKESYINSMVVCVSGLSTAGNYIRYKYNQLDTSSSYISLKDGVNIIPINEQHRGGFYTSALTPFTNDVTITQLPLYPNALVFDGVDDYALLPSGASKLIKSVILDVVPLKFGTILYDQRRSNTTEYQFAVYHGENAIAYSARNNGDTYIDGVLNTTFIPNQLTGRHMQVAITNNNIEDIIGLIHIGCSIGKSLYSPMALYRITGFTEVLTPDQIWKWYQKNQPKGGDK